VPSTTYQRLASPTMKPCHSVAFIVTHRVQFASNFRSLVFRSARAIGGRGE